jgi:hypothetical protein
MADRPAFGCCESVVVEFNCWKERRKRQSGTSVNAPMIGVKRRANTFTQFSCEIATSDVSEQPLH